MVKCARFKTTKYYSVDPSGVGYHTKKNDVDNEMQFCEAFGVTCEHVEIT